VRVEFKDKKTRDVAGAGFAEQRRVYTTTMFSACGPF
jgi:hypothetical protein